MSVGLRRLLGVSLLGILLYGGVVAFSGYRQIQAVLSAFHWSAFAVALALASSNYALRFAKWQYYLKRLGIVHVPRAHSALVFLSGFVLTITPGKLGEVFKSAVLFRTHGVPIDRTAPIVLAERLTDVMAIVLLVVVGSLGFQGGSYWAATGAGAVALVLLFVLWEPPARWLIRVMAGRPRLARLAPSFSRAYDSLRIVASPSALAWPRRFLGHMTACASSRHRARSLGPCCCPRSVGASRVWRFTGCSRVLTRTPSGLSACSSTLPPPWRGL